MLAPSEAALVLVAAPLELAKCEILSLAKAALAAPLELAKAEIFP